MVFYCSLQAAELDIKGTEMPTEALNQVQLGHLRIYHAACLMADAAPEVMYHRTPSGRSHGWQSLQIVKWNHDYIITLHFFLCCFFFNWHTVDDWESLQAMKYSLKCLRFTSIFFFVGHESVRIMHGRSNSCLQLLWRQWKGAEKVQ